MKPSERPWRPHFSSGPCAKRPGWSYEVLADACVGRSHRSGAGRAKLRAVIERSRELLGIPADYRVGIVPASDTGAMEMALWSLLGVRGVDVFAWESFSYGWVQDITTQLKIEPVRVFEAPYGDLPDLSLCDFAHDVVFAWNGTTSGVCVPDGDWIEPQRSGLTICDATSAVFAMDLPWEKLDVTTYSWQKALGGEAQHGMLILSPRAVERLQEYVPPWPLPKIFRLTNKGQLIDGVFVGDTINTPSLLCVEDVLDALDWVESIGGLPALITRSQKNLSAVTRWVKKTDWVDFLAASESVRSSTSICLKIVDATFNALDAAAQAQTGKGLVRTLEREGVAFDIGSYRSAPPGLRLWGGATVETADLEALFPWLEWAWALTK